MKDLWEIYDELLALVSQNSVVDECLIGLHWTLVKSGGIGLAMTPLEGEHKVTLSGKIIGMSVRELAECVKSWNYFEAAIGLSAINSVINTKKNVENITNQPLVKQKYINGFDYFNKMLKGKKVAVIGHFPGIEKMSEFCKLSILERIQQHGDYPDSACEYVLPKQDFVFITASTLENKTLPRILELCSKSFTILLGPSTPLAPVLFNYGINALVGNVVIDSAKSKQIVAEGGTSVDLRPYISTVILLKDNKKSSSIV
jgi:hypothetical protein